VLAGYNRAMIPNERTLALAFFITILANPAFPQAAALGPNCDLSVIGATETKSFLTFDRELREALSKQDAGMTALLVKYPLRINDDRGSYYLHDAASFGFRFQEVFTPAVREAVLKQRSDTIWCNSTGIMYGDGVVWVNQKGQGYAIETVNQPLASGPPKRPMGAVEFVCDSEKHRVIVDLGANGVPRYRAWNKPRSFTEKPDMEIPDGKKEYEGSGSCRYFFWTFTSGSTKYRLDEPGGCFEDSHQPPTDSHGSLNVSVPGKPDVSWWCR
jgi:hypothetical protein